MKKARNRYQRMITELSTLTGNYVAFSVRLGFNSATTCAKPSSIVLLPDLLQFRSYDKRLIEPATFDRLADESPYMICRYHPDNETAFVNRASLDFMGYGEREALRSDFYELIHPQDRARVETADNLAVSESSILRVRYRFRAASQKYQWIHEHCQPSFDTAGNLVGYVGSSRVLTNHTEEE